MQPVFAKTAPYDALKFSLTPDNKKYSLKKRRFVALTLPTGLPTHCESSTSSDGFVCSIFGCPLAAQCGALQP